MNERIQEQIFPVSTTEFDAAFDGIKGLTWLPWVGQQYSSKKILVLGESHYCYDSHTPLEIEHYRNETREVVAEYVNDPQAGNQYKTFAPITQILNNTMCPGQSRVQVWSQIAFMNLIQACMQNNSHRPHWEQFLRGWRVVLEIISYLRPNVCICFSTDKMRNRINFNRLEEFTEKIPFAYSITHTEDTAERIGRCIVASPGKICIGQYGCYVIFIQHASRIKGQAIDRWIEFLNKTIS